MLFRSVDNAPPNSSYPNPVLYEKGSGMFLFAESFAKGLLRTADEQRQGITVAVVSCLLFCGIKFALCELGRHTRDVLSLADVVYSA